MRPLPPRPFALLRGVGFLAAVPLGTLENVALRLQPLAVAAGEAIVRQGEPGDRFYLVDSGTLAVHADGRELARLGPGDCFGEIALLRGTPRMATVTAVEPVLPLRAGPRRLPGGRRRPAARRPAGAALRRRPPRRGRVTPRAP